MTKAQSVDLDAISEGVANLAEAYKEPTDKVLDPEAIGESLLEKLPTPTGWRILVGSTLMGVRLEYSMMMRF